MVKASGKPGANPQISVVIPAYNEALRIGEPISRTTAFLNNMFASWEIIVVDDGSDDETQTEVAKVAAGHPQVHLIRHENNRGKGAAVRTGVLGTAGEWVLFTDADGAIPIEELEKLAEKLTGDNLIVIGSKGLQTTHGTDGRVWYRVAMGRAFNLFCRLLLVPGFRDTQCGFKLFDGEVARRLFSLQKLDNFAFDLEILFLARQLGLGVCEVPVRWANIRGSRVSIIRDSLKMLLSLFTIRFMHGSKTNIRRQYQGLIPS